MGTTKLIVGAVAAGALAGLLFAPSKGSVTRRRIAHQANSVADEIKNTFEEMVDSVSERIDSVRGDVMHLRKQLIH
jgi:gas vesicle protein